MAEAYIPRGDPGPLPTSRKAMGGRPADRLVADPEPYLELVAWIFNGMNIYQRGHRQRFAPMTAEQRVAWMRRNTPRTYALLAAGQHWPQLSDL